jgi:hypothetical protein
MTHVLQVLFLSVLRKIGVPSTENTRDENYLTLIPSLAITQHPSIITHNYTNFTLGFHINPKGTHISRVNADLTSLNLSRAVEPTLEIIVSMSNNWFRKKTYNSGLMKSLTLFPRNFYFRFYSIDEKLVSLQQKIHEIKIT